MIPKNPDINIQIEEQTGRTYKFIKDKLVGQIDKLESVKQTIKLILSVERYNYLIYSWNYGIELQDLIGMPKEYVYSELKRRIKEALMQDNRIENVNRFAFKNISKDKITVTFTVGTIYGDVNEEVSVNV